MERIFAYLQSYEPPARAAETVTLIFERFLWAGIFLGFLIAVILLCRFLLRRYRRSYSYGLWISIPLFCLSAAAPPSLFRMAGKGLQSLTGTAPLAFFHMPEDNLRTASSSAGTSAMASETGGSAAGAFISRENFLWILFLIWLAGILILLILTVRASLTIGRSVRFATKTEEPGVWESDLIRGPFVKGLFYPRIYLPVFINPEHRKYILLHERFHIRRKDNFTLFFAQILVILFWFQPMVWLARELMRRDMEISCDERATEGLEKEDIAGYSSALLACGTGRAITFSASMGNRRSVLFLRISAVMTRKKKSLLLPAAAAICCLTAVSSGFLFLSNTAVSETIRETETVAAQNILYQTEEDVMPDAAEEEISTGTDIHNRAFADTTADTGTMSSTVIDSRNQNTTGSANQLSLLSQADTPDRQENIDKDKREEDKLPADSLPSPDHGQGIPAEKHETETDMIYEPGIISYDPDTGVTVWMDSGGATVLSFPDSPPPTT